MYIYTHIYTAEKNTYIYINKIKSQSIFDSYIFLVNIFSHSYVFFWNNKIFSIEIIISYSSLYFYIFMSYRFFYFIVFDNE